MRLHLALGALLATTAITAPAKAADLEKPGIAAYDKSVSENSGTIPIVVQRVGPLKGQVKFTFKTLDDTAKAGVDYSSMSGEGIIKSSAKSTTIKIPVIDNKIVDGDRSFLFRILSTSNGTIVDDTAIGTITNEDVAPPTKPCWDGSTVLTTANCPAFPVITVANTTSSETGPALNFVVTRSGKLDVTTTLQWSTLGGTATAGSDYVAASGTLVFNPGETVKSVSVDTIDDTIVEPNETVGFHLTGQNVTLPATDAVGTITSDDVAMQTCWDGKVIPATSTCAAFPQVSVSGPTVNETDGVANFTITRSGNTSIASIVNYATGNGTAMAGTDYVAASGSVNFGVGETTKTVAVTITNDTEVEPNETFSLFLTGTNINFLTAAANATIVSDDVAPPPPPPTPGSGVASEGDSISVFWAQNHTGIFAKNHPTVKFCGLAVGGAGISGVASRADKVDTCNPKVLTLLIGANDLNQWNRTTAGWLTDLWAYTDSMRAKGYKVAVGTVLPRCTSATTYDIEHNRRRNQEANPAIRAAVGTHIDAVIDYAADPVIGPDSAACDKNIYQDGLHPTDGNAALTGGQNILANIYTPVVEKLLGIGGTTPPPPVQCPDGTTVPAGQTCPVTPPPTNTSETGLPAIASNFDVNTTIATATVPGTAAPDVVGAFRFICGAGQLSYDDPIVMPGMPGMSHLHQYYGNTKADANSTYASLRASGDSTCNNMGNGTAANRSAYWMPAMLDGKGHVVMPDYVSVYYKQEPFTSAACTNAKSLGGKPVKCVNIPNGINFIQGFNMKTGQDSTHPGAFVCGNAVWRSDVDGMNKVNNTTCPVGTQLIMRIQSLRCWNGQVSSPDHFSNMAEEVYRNGKAYCPDTHLFLIPQFTIGAAFTIGTGDDTSLWHLSSDAMFPQYVRGRTLHFDYFEGWDVGVKDMWWRLGCIAKLLNCSSGNMGNGYKIKGAVQPAYGWKNPNRLVAIPANPNGSMAH